MKKRMYLIILATLCLFFKVDAQGQNFIMLTGRVTDSDGKGLSGASVNLKASKMIVMTDQQGRFTLNCPVATGVLLIRFIGYSTKAIEFGPEDQGPFNIRMLDDPNMLAELNVVSTGYQTLPKDRATGSFVRVDSALLNRSVSTSILDRLDGVASGLVFNKSVNRGSNFSNLSIRGRSTLFANPNPLIVLDNFPYEGDLNNINPNDIESVTVLKDAAAASIWGSRAGNGVIVITSKKGKTGADPVISFNGSVSFTSRPDLFAKPQLSSGEYIGVQQMLFNKGFYDDPISTGYMPVSAAVEVFLLKRMSKISAVDSAARIDGIAAQDIRKDINRYLNRVAVNQQYQLGISGGGAHHNYYLSGGFDRNLFSAVTDSYQRFTFNSNTTSDFLKGKLKWTTGFLLTDSRNRNNTSVFNPLVPYGRLADDSGGALALEKNLRALYTDTAGAGRLLDWQYRPLDENRPRFSSGITDYRISSELGYQITNALRASFNVVHEKGMISNEQNYASDSYYTRDYLNSYSAIDPITGLVTTPVPLGDIIDRSGSNYVLNTGRFQLNYSQSFGVGHTITALAGMEISQNKGFANAYRLYGYDPSSGADGNGAVDYLKDFAQYYGYGTIRNIPGTSSAGLVDRSRSYYFNGSYAFQDKYIASFSSRWDESNIFGVKTNQKGVPLWSAGLAWNISHEDFSALNFLPLLKLRATLGYNGNTDKSATAFLTSENNGGLNDYNNPYLIVISPPNPALRWEKVRMLNLGIDFGLQGNVLSGSLEYFSKRSTDLIANTTIAPQTGFVQYRGNSADLQTKGLDITLNTSLCFGEGVNWSAAFLLSYAKDKVTSYKVKQSNNLQVVQNNFLNPLEGYPYYALFSFPWAGLDDQGAPQGYLNGQLSKDYSGMLFSTDPKNLVYNGSALPTVFGSFRNTFSFKGFELSVMLSYRLGYYFRRTSVNYSALFAGDYHQDDFADRWQKAGDEFITNVPAMNYPANILSDYFYSNSSALVERGDNIRLQDVRLAYTFSKRNYPALPFGSLQLFCFGSNLGMIWKANKHGLDPDAALSYPIPRTVAFGLKANF